MVVRSSRYGPTIWTPTGSPSRVRPAGAMVAGRSHADHTRPGEHVEVGPARAVHGDRAPVDRLALVVRDGSSGGDRAEEHVVGEEEGAPRRAVALALLVDGEPVAVAEGDRARDLDHRALAVRGVARRQCG